VAICASPINRPGITPASISAPMLTVSTPPHTIIMIDGGMIAAITADTAVTATEKLRS
jgi:hypothetical protein